MQIDLLTFSKGKCKLKFTSWLYQRFWRNGNVELVKAIAYKTTVNKVIWE